MTWVKRFAESVKRAGSDVAEDDAQGGQHHHRQGPGAGLLRMRGRGGQAVGVQWSLLRIGSGARHERHGRMYDRHGGRTTCTMDEPGYPRAHVDLTTRD